MSEIVIFGGTFDPPTLAHEAIISSCLDRPDMDEVWVMPSGSRADKPSMLSDCVRLEMLDEMHAESFDLHERLVITEFEMKLPRPTQTADTVEALNRDCPEDNFWFVFGADSYKDMPAWKAGEELRRDLNMLIVPRAGIDMPPEGGNIRHLKVDQPISSTIVREAILANKPIDGFVSSAIARYLEVNHCYNR